ncbi:ATP-binding cassette domain-containing protein [Curtobacterium herbarum]|uniref:ABC transporter ATP-binding protein n=1 Tax=Curtobacterium herbarum TaxID=150122 RepID=A0ABP4K3L9_9MICO|nr:ATP-binding cassette domain-containing protein [Curtobacterium herbarum]MBM7475658.1 ABC-type multidrug transport system ATPase subunit [Curtobacterium herbarum]MCS6543571.1 ATP-binding cassette domain-containing protein [Curtobacterium herbarum]
MSIEFGSGRTVLLGPNGAGKSTLMGLLASVHRPQRGSVELRGVGTPFARRSLAPFRRAVAWLPQHAGTFPGLTVREHVAYAGWLKGLGRKDAYRRAVDALGPVGLVDRADSPATQLSGGQTRRMHLAGALVHDAQVILLDEPTAGFDPQQQARFHETVQALDPAIAVVVSTHDVSDLSGSYDRVVVLDGGEVRFDGPVSGFLDVAPTGTATHRRGEAAYSTLVRGER